ncbi:MAG TPA: hypothetical protein VK492_04435 [Chitinophagaceae bacterium]|nr:hypothetical protein [Chitinophagaceae bacterium]
MGKFEFAIVSGKQSKILPYPYIYIEKDGSYRELSKSECEYLEMKFHPNDGTRPYVKSRYTEKTPDGDISGFLSRKKYNEHFYLGGEKKSIVEVLKKIFGLK